MSEKQVSAEENNARMAMKAVRKEIKRILDNWDPLCMKGLSGFDHQYENLVGPIAVMLRKGAGPMEIARHLEALMRDEWKLPSNPEKSVQVAEKIHRVGTMFHVSSPP